MRFLFYSIKGAGHVNPTLPIVQALTAKGHEVFYSVTIEWQEKLEALGAVFLNMGGSGPFTTAQYHTKEFPYQLFPAAAAITPRLVKEAQGIAPDVIIYDWAAVWGGVVARHLRCANAISVSTLLFSDPRAMGFSPDDLRNDALNVRAMQDLKQQFGSSGEWDNLAKLYGDDALLYSCPSLNPNREHFDTRFHFVGSCAASANDPKDSNRNLEEHGLGHLVTAKRVIYLSFGTVAVGAMKLGPEVFRPFIDAAKGWTDTQLLISTSAALDPALLGDLPPNVTAKRSVPQLDVLSHCDAFITHAGANSMHEALALGVPLVCVPFFADQPYNAKVVEGLGLGVQLSHKALSADAVTQAVNGVTQAPSFKEAATRIGAELREAGGAVSAVAVLEQLHQNS